MVTVRWLWGTPELPKSSVPKMSCDLLLAGLPPPFAGNLLVRAAANRGRFSNAPGPGVRLGFHGEFFRPSQGPSPVPGSRAYRPTGHQRRPAGKEAGPARRKQTAAAKESRQGQGAPAFPPRVVWQVAASGRHRPLSRPARFISPLAPFFSTSRRFCSVAL